MFNSKLPTIICPNPNCNYTGPVKKVPRGSLVIAFILMFLFVLPGVLYLIFMQGYRCYCPRCGLQISADI